MHLQIVQSLFQAWRCRMKRSIKPQKHIDRWQAAKLQHVTHRELIDSASRCHAGHGWTLQLAGGSKERSGTLKTSENEIHHWHDPSCASGLWFGESPNSQTNIQLYRRTRKGMCIQDNAGILLVFIGMLLVSSWFSWWLIAAAFLLCFVTLGNEMETTWHLATLTWAGARTRTAWQSCREICWSWSALLASNIW